ncbi:xanthine dehydrogenase-like [Histomonas meleagridis]|uniref:xanthine dehydrogenase-like n=1 Tax=Histomonas meleagridis TaxID=135588 RepID=UPI00355942C2|nr:xanthine dehydrogenase-like [Histomonas meleagridis]KAH0806409.1 xanthine dehydrogenase-like [Histomonas meleagridis]
MLRSIQGISRSSKSFKHSIEFILNGEKVVLEEGQFNPTQSLTHYLRSDGVDLRGTKYVCGEGGCGACTVVVSQYDPITKKIKHRPINSCLMPVGQCHGQSITTVEALGSTRKGLHPIQQSYVAHHATQCGYCTPGFIMNSYALLLAHPKPTLHQIESQFDGNLCRCTGYRSIHDALREFSSDGKVSDNEIKDSTPYKTMPHREPSPPPVDVDPADVSYKGVHFYVPTTLEQLIELKKQHPKSTLVVGSSEVGIDLKYKGATLPAYISTHKVQELYHIDIKDNKLIFGASTSLQDILDFCDSKMPKLKEHERRLLRELRQRLSVFSSTQIRNTACVVGNIAAAGAVTDMSNFLLASDSILTVINAETGEKFKMSMDNFFTSYRTTKLKPTDVITEVEIPLMKPNEHIFVYKQAHRREDDICIVSACIKCRINEVTNIIEDFKIAYSGMAAYPQNAKSVEKYMIGKEFTLKTIQDAYPLIEKDLPLAEQAPGGHIPFRRELSKSFLFRFYHQVEKERNRPYDPSASDIIPHPISKFGPIAHIKHGDFEVTRKDTIGNPVHHRAARQQTTGEALFTLDMPTPYKGLYGGFVLSTKAHAKIIKADYSKCLQVPGVVDVVTYKDIEGINLVGDVIKDEPVFPEDEVQFVGHPIALVLAKDNETAWRAAKLAEIEYKELPAILNLEQAIEEKSFLPMHHICQNGNPDEVFKNCPHVLEGETNVGGQLHFQLELNNCIVEPSEDDKLIVTASTQNVSFTQEEIHRVCNLPLHNIDVKTNRLGGAFGGKETRSTVYTNACAVAARKVNRPVRMQLDREIDMLIAGGRHPMKTKYKIGFDDNGKLLALDAKVYSDCGWSFDISPAVCDRAILHLDSSYNIPVYKAESIMCKLNQMSNTAFRGFGAPQGVFAMEAIIQHIADYLHKQPEEIRQLNLYKEGDQCPYGTKLIGCNNRKAWDYIIKATDYWKLKKEVEEFNRNNKYKKRGISINPLKYGISFTFGTLNQGGALVQVYKDGTVLISHAGVEMGQGLHTKVAAVAAKALNIPIQYVRIDETSTAKVANTSPTAASTGTDINGWAVYNACQIINSKLNKYRTPDRTFAQACQAAYLDRVDICAHGFYSTPGVYFDWDKGTGNPFAYFVYGAAASVVEIDTLTGDHVVLRSDLVFDVGESINKAIDIGQIEGAFIQGYGLLTMEEITRGDGKDNKWLKPGVLHTNGPGYYKIPGFNDLPGEFNAHLLPGSRNPTGVYSSKAIGEPPLILAQSVGFAIYEAIRAARRDRGLNEWIPVNFPLTSDRIRVLSEPKI